VPRAAKLSGAPKCSDEDFGANVGCGGQCGCTPLLLCPKFLK
jgi:hypothetical protein